ncbi:hypothetical protein MMC24_001255, partial [Lignoscripta atroalba]|nr:hypothetical protein [Lignoscripta atroalba]
MSTEKTTFHHKTLNSTLRGVRYGYIPPGPTPTPSSSTGGGEAAKETEIEIIQYRGLSYARVGGRFERAAGEGGDLGGGGGVGGIGGGGGGGEGKEGVGEGVVEVDCTEFG